MGVEEEELLLILLDAVRKMSFPPPHPPLELDAEAFQCKCYNIWVLF